ncbi:ABC transporter permease [uncultured Meiothermus sp.]|jgi:peptide/nickel transport system permease protein|uniref:ABC transporter permease n=1 Tax=uncultured Meiothermus sp. TaxID=157471 RepID=UPI002626AA6F|nr:ABC transporter permease [uncultured Meiothermus sp.]
MFGYIVRRLFQLVPTFLGATLLAFLVIQLAPGDFVTRLELDPTQTRESIAELRQQFGLDQSMPVQYAKWLSGIMQGYLGLSLSYKTDVWSVIGPRILNSLVLVLLATLVIYMVAIPIGVYSAVNKYTLSDRTFTVLAFLGLAVPNFFFGLIMLFLAVWLDDLTAMRILPIGGMTTEFVHIGNLTRAAQWLLVPLLVGLIALAALVWQRHRKHRPVPFSWNLGVWLLGFGTIALLFPFFQGPGLPQSMPYTDAPFWARATNVLWHAVPVVIVVATAGLAGLIRVMRGQMLDVLSQDYIRTARSKGLNERVVIYKHALRNAVIPFIAGIGGLLPALIGGAGLVEVVMAWPGITPALLEAISAIDVYVIMGLITITTLLLIVGNLVSDLLLAWVDPRIRYS